MKDNGALVEPKPWTDCGKTRRGERCEKCDRCREHQRTMSSIYNSLSPGDAYDLLVGDEEY